MLSAEEQKAKASMQAAMNEIFAPLKSALKGPAAGALPPRNQNRASLESAYIAVGFPSDPSCSVWGDSLTTRP